MKYSASKLQSEHHLTGP